MLEKQLAATFNSVFDNYKIWTMTIKSGGLPDKGIQLNNSRMIWFELKIVMIPPVAHTFRVPNLESHQASWLANWQKNDGDCYLFLGLEQTRSKTVEYGVLQCNEWRDWLKVPKLPMRIDSLQIVTPDAVDIFYWFRNRYGLIRPASSDHGNVK
jgi:hypothetical protein